MFLKLARSLAARGFYDIAVIGGGSGGIACAHMSSELGRKVVLFDHVDPSAIGTSWGIGGTCVNVGCIPKKLFRSVSELFRSSRELELYGWKLEAPADSWMRIRERVQEAVMSSSSDHLRSLSSAGVDVIQSPARLVDSRTIEYRSLDGAVHKVESRNVVIATGCRPIYPPLSNSRAVGITSDDLFSLPHSPGKTLVVGASYVALECASFLCELGLDVLVRSHVLRGFDREMSSLVESDLYGIGVKFVYGPEIREIVVQPDDRKEVMTDKSLGCFDTILFATGRRADLSRLNLPQEMRTDARSGKIVVNENFETNVPGLFAIGDVVHGYPELTPVAATAGTRLASHLFDPRSSEAADSISASLRNIPTCIFTHTEYAKVGLNEEDAPPSAHIYKKAYSISGTFSDYGYSKVIVDSVSREILGLHIFGNNASEIIQGFSVAMNSHLTIVISSRRPDLWQDTLDGSVGLHPTHAESLLRLDVTSASGC